MPHTPKLCRHKATHQGYVTLNGKEHYLGHWSPDQKKPPAEVRDNYDRLISRWLTNGRRLPEEQPTSSPTSVNEVILAFVRYAAAHYAGRTDRTGKQKDSAETDGIKKACRVVSNLFGRLPASEFGPKALKQVREQMTGKDWSRGYVNKQVNRVKRMFRWAVAEEMVPPSVLHGLSAVAAIRKGEPGVREKGPVKPVPQQHVGAALPFMSPQVRAMVELQQLCGARPGEVVIMRAGDIDRTGKVWVYKPEKHKTEHRGQSREIYLGPKAQRVLEPWLRAQPEEYLFSPREAFEGKNRGRSEIRKTPRYPSHMERNRRLKEKEAKRPKGDHYTTDSYRKAVEYACFLADRDAREKALAAARAVDPTTPAAKFEDTVFVPCWSPNRLRHNAATNLRKEFGIELARLGLGHKHGFTTEIYADADREKVMDVFARVG
jgi:integrase